MTDNELNLACAELMGWEHLKLGYFGTKEETPRMVELSDWLDEHSLFEVGEYFIKEDKGEWMHCYEFMPTDDLRKAWEVATAVHESTGRLLTVNRAKFLRSETRATFHPASLFDGDTMIQEQDESPARVLVTAALKAAGKWEEENG